MCYSADSVYDSDEHSRFTTEFLNSPSVLGVPEHCVVLKVGKPVILLRIFFAFRWTVEWRSAYCYRGSEQTNCLRSPL